MADKEARYVIAANRHGGYAIWDSEEIVMVYYSPSLDDAEAKAEKFFPGDWRLG